MEFLNSSFGEFIFIVAIITLSLSVVLRSYTVFIPQAVLLLALLFIPNLLENIGISYLMLVLQVALIAFVLFKFKKALDLNYHLILETTHLIPRKITAGGGFGGICKYPK